MLKKILIVLIGLIVVAVGSLLVYGLLNPSVTYEVKVEINKPKDVVWTYFSDPAKMGEWLEGFQKIETISGNPNEVGSKYRLTFIEDGREIVMIETVKEFKANDRFVFLLEHEYLNSDVEVVVTENAGKTILVQRVTAVGSNIFWRTMIAVMKSGFTDRGQKSLDKLKKNIEAL